MPTNLKLNDKLVLEVLRLGHFKSKREAVNNALAEYVQRRQRLRILDLAGKIDFDPKWDYKKMRRDRSFTALTVSPERTVAALHVRTTARFDALKDLRRVEKVR